MSIAAIIIVVIVIIAIAAAGVVVLKLAYGPGNIPPSYPVVQAPIPAVRPSAIETTRPEQVQGEHGRGRTRKKDMRDVPLPRCPQCGTAAAYMQEKCSKCGAAIDTRTVTNSP